MQYLIVKCVDFVPCFCLVVLAIFGFVWYESGVCYIRYPCNVFLAEIYTIQLERNLSKIRYLFCKTLETIEDLLLDLHNYKHKILDILVYSRIVMFIVNGDIF